MEDRKVACVDEADASALMMIDVNSREWTDEKHYLFLKSMESAFVNQLYQSIALSRLNSQKRSKRVSNRKPCPARSSSSGQCKSLHAGSWSKMKLNRDDDDTRVEQDEVSSSLSRNPWIKHFRKHEYSASHVKAPFEATVFNKHEARNFQIWKPDCMSNDRFEEMTDQNFIDEE